MAAASIDEGSRHPQHVEVVPFNTSEVPLVPVLLHGNLDICVKEANRLPNMDAFNKKFTPLSGTSDPYVTVSVANAVTGRTSVIRNSENPVWMQHFYVPVAHHTTQVLFVVKDSDVVGSQLIGAVGIPAEQLVSNSVVKGTFPILNASGQPCKPGAVLTLSVEYTPVDKMAIYCGGVGSDPQCKGVPETYFPLRRGGKVTLYQDAHVDGSIPSLKLDRGLKYVQADCWRDICDAIRQARRLIYITGWSVFHKVQLVRYGAKARDSVLGDLLKSKSEEGVRVLLLVWDDPTSKSIFGYKTEGVMQTHDEETRAFFKNSSVQVLLCPRSIAKTSWAKKDVETIYSHHQKTVIVDADAGIKRRIMAFVGGLDLCEGRYDTPEHSLFSTLNTLHKDDYHNPNYTGSTAGCPRQPWHDLHCRIEGPAAYDVLQNFEERWLRASKPRGLSKISKFSDVLLKVDRVPEILGITDARYTSEKDPEGWHVQVFRSIDSNSVKGLGFPKDPKDAKSKNLICGKNVLIDMSIHTAYVKAIRTAQHFIYIENQFFLGSSYNWADHKSLGANNLIPMEIALKIASKIRANQRFAVYIVIPMFPEGNPTSSATQRILLWQHHTMQMMYGVIYNALKETGLDNEFEPQDYLNFFCLGTRESSQSVQVPPTSNGKNSHPPNTPQALSITSRRFMIHVNSKGMIVDDEFVLLGSANINQRSLEGTRDTEIAMGAYQPHYTWAHKGSNPNGQIFGYRMSLWAEHIGDLESSFEEPHSLECVRRVRLLGEQNWKQYADDKVTDMTAHLLKYPVDVDRKGNVNPLSGCPNFPDVGGSIVGSFVSVQENLTI
uniref:phospholipase D beta 1-like n=1 Tax=Erigeron canadensis TaxID=72917 RepID=UPI001CB8A180|nr:phospholipase D beta 1-like [Erigeron canadensis]